mgnify:FL=1|tara:strand:- start:959 stop:1555 length:597 start_codon:yes stop_codon:yes gene_type:complete
MRNANIENYTDSEPISLPEAKDYLRVDFNNDDTFISELISIARVKILKDTGQVMGLQTITEYFTNWGTIPTTGGNLILPLSYMGYWDGSNDFIVKYFDINNVEQTLTINTDYLVIQHMGLIKVQFINTFNTFDRLDAISIEYEIEPANEDSIRPLLIAMYLLIQHYYDNRSAVSFLKVDEMPMGYFNIINQYKNYIWQ